MLFLRLTGNSLMVVASELVVQLEDFVQLIDTAIESEDWEGLNSLLVDRRAALEQLCALPLSPFERKAVVAMMVQMQTTDRQFEAVVQSQKDALQKQAFSLAHDRKVIQAYQT